MSYQYWLDSLPMRLVLQTSAYQRPSVSYGLMIRAADTNRWAIVQRRHSAEYLLLMRGLYRRSHLSTLVPKLTSQENKNLRDALSDLTSFLSLGRDLRLSCAQLGYGHLRLTEVASTLSPLLSLFASSHCELSWFWPKGQPERYPVRESPRECAIREAIEELEIQLPEPVSQGTVIHTYIVNTASGQRLETHLLEYVIDKEVELPVPTTSNIEVGARRWVTSSELLSLIS